MSLFYINSSVTAVPSHAISQFPPDSTVESSGNWERVGDGVVGGVRSDPTDSVQVVLHVGLGCHQVCS